MCLQVSLNVYRESNPRVESSPHFFFRNVWIMPILGWNLILLATNHLQIRTSVEGSLLGPAWTWKAESLWRNLMQKINNGGVGGFKFKCEIWFISQRATAVDFTCCWSIT